MSIGTFLVLLLVGLMLCKLLFGAKARLRRRATRAEHQARVQRRQWFDLVERQMARGFAGDASADQATAALRGSGGRTSKLDEEFF